MSDINHLFTFGIVDEAFNAPTGVAGFEDRIVVSDLMLHRVQVFDDQGRLEFVIGERGHGPGEFLQPRGVATNGDRIYVADEGNNRVQAFDELGNFLWMTPEGSLRRPFDVAILNGFVVIADSDNNRVVVLDDSGNEESEITGLTWPRAVAVGGSVAELYVLDDGDVFAFERIGQSQPLYQWTVPTPPLTAPMTVYGSPVGLAYDAVNERVVVSDGGGPVLHVFDPDGSSPGIKWSYGTGRREFVNPQGLGAADGRVLIADTGNSRVVSDEWGIELGGKPQALGHVQLPSDIAFSRDAQMLYVADTDNGRVHAFGSDGRDPFTFGEADLESPTGVTIDEERKLVHVADPRGLSVKVVSYGFDGALVRSFFITMIPNVSGSGFANQCRIATDPRSGELLLSFRGLGTVGRYDQSGAALHVYNTTVGTIGTAGTPQSPTDVVAGPDGTIFVADPDGRRIVQLDDRGGYEEYRDPTIGMRAESLVLDASQDRIIAAGESSIFQVDLGRDRITEVAANGFGPGEFREITAVALDGDLVYVAERGNNRIQAIELD